MPAFCHQVHLGEVRPGDSIRTPTLGTLPTLTKAATNYFLARPRFAQSVTPVSHLRPGGADRLALARRAEQRIDVERVPGGIGDCRLAHRSVQRLTAANICVDSSQLAGLVSLLSVLIRADAPAMRLVNDALAELAIGDSELFGVGDGIKQQVGFDRFPRAVAQVGVELLSGVALLLQPTTETLLVVFAGVQGVVFA